MTEASAARSGEAVWLRTDGPRVVDGEGEAITLRGFGLGGWLTMENFITGYGSSERLHREMMRNVLGDDLSNRLFDGLLTAFFGSEDAGFLASLGVNSLRIPLNYRHLLDDQEPDSIRAAGFEHLDRAVEDCASHGIYTIIDLHAAPGGQNGHWHCDTQFHHPQLWQYADFRRRTVAVWEAIAQRYRDNPWVAGYNLLNEPSAEDPSDLVDFYRALEEAIRHIDERHMLFLDGNRFATEFPGFGDALANTVYAIHQYPPPCRYDGGPYPGSTDGEYYDRQRVEADFVRMTKYMVEQGAPIWVGEFGPVYTGTPAGDEMKRQLLIDELAIYADHGAGWSLWTYKDMGMMGVVRVRPDSPWMRRTEQVRLKKARLGVDIGGSDDLQISEVMAPIRARVQEEFPWFKPYPFGATSYINRLVRAILLAEPLAQEFAEAFAGVDVAQIDELTSSYRFGHCEPNPDVAAIVTKACQG